MKRTPPPAPEPPEPPPEGLSDAARALWRGAIHKCRTASRRELLHQACRALDRADEARTTVQTQGLVSTTASTGAQHVNPLVKLELESRRQFLAILTALDLTNRFEPGGVLGPMEAK